MSATPQVAVHVLSSVDPATLERVGEVPATTPEGLSEAVSEASAAQHRFARAPLAERSRLLDRVAAELLAARHEIVECVVAETGKPRLEALTADVFVSLDALVWLARNVRKVLGDERVPFPQPHLRHKSAILRYEPLGVVAVIAPWNFPLGVPLTQVATAVAGGNGVVLKPSELTPLTGAWVEELFRRAGAPAGLVRVAQGPGATVGDALVGHPGVAKVVFTGSTAAGRVVAARCAGRLRPVTLELGGNDPMVVLDDADLPRAVEGALWGAFTNCGQVCSGIERIFVERAVHDAFVTALAERAAALRLGDGHDPATDMGPLITEEQRARVEGLVEDALDHGAELVTGGNRPPVGLPGWFLEPTVLVGETAGARVQSEEIFGPAVLVVKVDNSDEAVLRANASPYALGASVWSRSPDRARQVALELHAGSVWTNDHAYSYGACQAPWGGRKESGHGRTHSRHGLYAVTSPKFVDADRGRLRPPWWFPYTERAVEGFHGGLDILYGASAGARVVAAWRHRSGLVELGRRVLGR